MNGITLPESQPRAEFHVARLFWADVGTLSFHFEWSNTTYRFMKEWKAYYLRKLNQRWQVSDLLEETSLIDSLRHVPYVPKLVRIGEHLDERTEIEPVGDFAFRYDGVFYTVTEGMAGSGFDWGGRQFEELGRTLADFHRRTDEILDKVEIKDRRLKISLPTTQFQNRSLGPYLERSRQSDGLIEKAIVENCAFVSAQIEGILEGLAWKMDDLEEGVIHNDFTPNNLLADGDTIIGVLDYEYASYRERLYDLAWTIATCSNGTEFGTMDADTVRRITRAYCQSANKKLNALDIEVIPHFVRLGITAAIRWTADQHFVYGLEKTRNFERNIRLLKWLGDRGLDFGKALV